MRGLMALNRQDGLKPLCRKGLRPSCLYCRRSVHVVGVGAARGGAALARRVAWVDALLDDPAFFAPFVPFFDPRMGRPSTPMEAYLRLMFLKFRYRLGYESLCREVSDSITWRAVLPG
jgi:hypothetical protein